MHTEPRGVASIDRIYLHKNEGPEQEGGAAGLLNYLQTIDGGYHVIVDDKTTVRAASDDELVWGEGGDNLHALSICLVGWSSEAAAQYGTDAYSQAEIERAAQQVAIWCRTYDIPVVHVAPGAPGVAPTERGIAEHADDHDPASQGHTDPGAGFPIAAFVQRVETINVEYLKTLVFYEWVANVRKTPLRAGISSWEVTALKEALDKIGEGPGNASPLYGPTLTERVAEFKARHNIGPQPPDGTEFGGVAMDALLKLL